MAPSIDRRDRAVAGSMCADLLSAPRLAIPYVPARASNQVDQHNTKIKCARHADLLGVSHPDVHT
jgi:hypothetical protein